ncbi:MAG TPA: hypothetical protein DCQ31_00845 [Bacteroidales bacterium]|nr:hypothetical protein [Bacteroidales bacterium]
MKKTTSIFIITLITLFLANSLFPHHHHHYKICVESSHCENDSKPHDHEENSNDHQHDGNEDVDACLLKQFIPNLSNHAQKNPFRLHFKTDFPILIFSMLFFEFENNFVRIPDFSSSPNIPSNYSVLVAKCFGLRAPPVV